MGRAPWLVHVLAPGIAEPALAVRCTRVTTVTVLAFGIAGYLGAALRSVHVFGPPAAIYAAYNIGILATMAALHRPLGVFSAAIGLAVGGALMVAVQVPSLRRHLGSATTSPVLLVALGAFVPVAVYTIARQGQVFVERFLGSELGAGTISHLNYAQKVAQVPMVLSVMVATVTFPMLARSAITGDTAAARERTAWDLRVVAAIVLGCSAYLIAFAPIVVSVLFEHGRVHPGRHRGHRRHHPGLHPRPARAGVRRHADPGLLLRRPPELVPRPGHGDRLAATAGISVLLAPVWHAMGIAAGNAVGITLTAGLMLRRLRWRGDATRWAGRWSRWWSRPRWRPDRPRRGPGADCRAGSVRRGGDRRRRGGPGLRGGVHIGRCRGAGSDAPRGAAAPSPDRLERPENAV
jgi:putative peptidoglycan lipid II flippase